MAKQSAPMEVVEPRNGRTFSHVVFDFDGTLSLIREGWPQVMIPQMIEVLAPLQHGMSPQALTALITEDVVELTGKETIFQMNRLAERVTQFGGTPADPLAYKAEYLRRLMLHIGHRREALKSGLKKTDDLLLPGSRTLLEGLVARGCTLYLASGTDQPYVVEEAKLLDVARYFGPHIYGAREDDRGTGNLKRMVIERLLRENNVHGSVLLGFGDGFVEIEEVTSAGGYAVGVASDEAAGGGAIDPWKRQRLMRAGAKAIIPDFGDGHALLSFLFD